MSNSTTPMAFQAAVRYSDIINSRYVQSSSNYVDIDTRIRDTIGTDTWKQVMINDALDNCLRFNSDIKSWDDLPLCESLMASMSDLLIDITMQRFPNLLHCGNILDIFDPFKVRPILVYRNADRPGKLIVWDGQHTLICLYLLAQRLNLDITKCMVPVVINRGTDTPKMRETFMHINGIGIMQLDIFDRIEQMLYAVQADDITRPDWVLVSDKQKAFAKRGMFLTNEKFGDHDRPGACSRLDEFFNSKYSLNVVDNFAEYFYQVCNSDRPVRPKEIWMMYEFFRHCEQEKINVDAAYITGIVNSLRVVDNGTDFDAVKFYHRAKFSYQNWWRSNKPNNDGSLLGISYAEHPIGLTFLKAQIKKNFNGPLPKSDCFKHWHVPASDLF